LVRISIFTALTFHLFKRSEGAQLAPIAPDGKKTPVVLFCVNSDNRIEDRPQVINGQNIGNLGRLGAQAFGRRASNLNPGHCFDSTTAIDTITVIPGICSDPYNIAITTCMVRGDLTLSAICPTGQILAIGAFTPMSSQRPPLLSPGEIRVAVFSSLGNRPYEDGGTVIENVVLHATMAPCDEDRCPYMLENCCRGSQAKGLSCRYLLYSGDEIQCPYESARGCPEESEGGPASIWDQPGVREIYCELDEDSEDAQCPLPITPTTYSPFFIFQLKGAANAEPVYGPCGDAGYLCPAVSPQIPPTETETTLAPSYRAVEATDTPSLTKATQDPSSVETTETPSSLTAEATQDPSSPPPIGSFSPSGSTVAEVQGANQGTAPSPPPIVVSSITGPVEATVSSSHHPSILLALGITWLAVATIQE